MGLINKIGNAVSELFASPAPFNPKKLNDPIALKTSWEPLVPGGTNFGNRKMEVWADHSFQISPSIVAYFFPAIFLLGGLLFLYKSFVQEPVVEGPDAALWIVGCSLALLIGMVWIYRLKKLIILFDKRTKTFYRQSVGLGLYHFGVNTQLTPLVEIHAVQIINEYIRGNKSSYNSYEVNVVLKDGSRLNVQDHGSLTQTFKCGRSLSKFLDVPLWDASLYEV